MTPVGKKALLLGSGELGKEVAIELQRYGVEVVACDKYANAPAMQVAHRSHVFSMLDAETLEKVVREEKPDHIIPEIEAIATPKLLELEKDGFHVTPTARAAWLTMNREGIRRLAAECGMTVSSYVLARAFNYRPKARLTARQEAVMETLMGCRSDLVNYTSALRGMNPEKRRQMFNSYPFMLEWLKELGRLAERVTDVLDKVRFSNRLPDGTRNGEDREDEP